MLKQSTRKSWPFYTLALLAFALMISTGVSCVRAEVLKTASADAHLLKNGSFEDGLTGWWKAWQGKAGKAEISDKEPAEGLKSLEIQVADTDTSRFMLRSPKMNVESGQAYEFSLNYFTGAEKAIGSTVRVIAYDEKSTFIGYFSGITMAPTASVWVLEQKAFIAPDNCHSVVIEFNFRKGVHCKLDNVQFYKMDEARQAEIGNLHQVENPLYNELLIPGTAPASPRTMPYWGYDISDPNHYRSAALRWGHPFSLRERFEELGKNRWAAFDSNGSHAALRREFDVPTNYYIYAAGHFMDKALGLAIERGAQAVIGKQPSPVDPAYVDAVVELLRTKKTLFGQPDRPKAAFVFFADELFGKLSYILPEERRTSDFWKKADETVRTKYGFGKYGMPASKDDDNAFRRIAYLRWQSDLAADALERIGKAIHETSPGVPFAGSDEVASPTPLDWEKIGKSVDIQMGQSLPAADGWRSFNPGYITKFMHDLSGKPVYPFIQVIKYGTSPSSETVHNWVDQTLRAGASGLFVGAMEWFDRDLNHPMYAAPEKWHTYKNLAEQVQRLPQIKYPQPDVALHYSSYTNMVHIDQRRFGAAYALLGPRAGAWFTVTNDFQIDRDPAKWDKFKVVVAPESLYVSQNDVKAMQDFARQGGTLILSDPDSLSWMINGEKGTQAQKEIQGVQWGDSVLQRNIKWNGATLDNATGFGRKVLWRDKSTSVIAQYADGSPAIVEHSIGKGRVVSFGFDAHVDSIVVNPDWRTAWQKMLQGYGIKTNQDIWRFTLPMPQPLAEPQGQCVTGNSVWMRQNKADFSKNSSIGGSYWYDVAPKAIADVEAAKDGIDFKNGKLTNRVAMAKIPMNASGNPVDKEVKALENWVVKFGENETAARTITFKLNHPVDLTRSNIVFSGVLPNTKIAVSDNGKNWKDVATIQSANAGGEVFLREAQFNARGQYVRFQLAKRPANSILTLSEIDLWATKP